MAGDGSINVAPMGVEWSDDRIVLKPFLDTATYQETVSSLEPGDLVVLFTDGITEAEDADEEEFGVERVADVTASLSKPSAEKLCDAILEAVEQHTHGGALHDDAGAGGVSGAAPDDGVAGVEQRPAAAGGARG